MTHDYYSDNDTSSDIDEDELYKQEIEEEEQQHKEDTHMFELYKLIQEYRDKENPFILDKLKMIDLYMFLSINNPIQE